MGMMIRGSCSLQRRLLSTILHLQTILTEILLLCHNRQIVEKDLMLCQKLCGPCWGTLMDVIHYFHVQEIYVNPVYASFIGGGAEDMIGGQRGSASYGGIGEMLEGVDQTMEEDFKPQGKLSQDDSIGAKRGRGAEDIERLLLGQRGDGDQSDADEEEYEYGDREDGEDGNDVEDTTSEQSQDF